MKAMKYSALAVFLMTNCHAIADESKVIFGIEIGSSSLDLENDLANEFNQEFLDDTGVSSTYSVGYRWANSWQVEGSLSASGNALFSLGLEDFYQAAEAKLMVGYSFQLAKHLRIVPLIGVSRWDVELQEGFLLNPGPEERIESDGTDFSYKVSAEFPIKKGFVLSLSYANTDTTFGDISMTQAGLKYEF